MKLKILMAILLISSTLIAEKTLLVLPYCTKNISTENSNHLLVTTRRIMFETDEYKQALSFNTEQLIFEKTNFDNCDYFLTENSSEKFKQIISSTNVQEILSCAVNFENGEFGLFFKLKNGQTGEIINSKAYGFDGDFESLIKDKLLDLLYDFFDIKDKRTKYVSLSASFGYLDNYSDYVGGFRLGYGSKKYGEIAIEANLYTEHLAENISFTYTTPYKYYLYLKMGFGFTSERKDNFSLTKYYDAPDVEKIKEMDHSVGILAAIGLSLPVSENFRVNISAETDIIYSEWEYLDNTTKKSMIYSYYPEVELSYQIRF